MKKKTKMDAIPENLAKRERFWSLLDEYKVIDRMALEKSIAHHMEYDQSKEKFTAKDYDFYMSLAYAIRDYLVERFNDTAHHHYAENVKRVYYLSLEYLIGRSLHNALVNLNIYDMVKGIIEDLGFDLDELMDFEPDAGLGNGGLGRLAACFLDSMATMGIPCVGYGIRYDYGIFHQRIVDGYQIELPDNWLRFGLPWEVERRDFAQEIKLKGRVHQYVDEKGNLRNEWVDTKNVLAVPYDTPIPGYCNSTVNALRLWHAKPTQEFDLEYFNSGDYIKAVERKSLSETITKVLYPKDDVVRGKELRLVQEYFLVSATLQDIIRRHKVKNESLSNLPEKAAIQLNDTHPSLAVAELMRILVDQEGFAWEEAWKITQHTIAYTNHTVMPEALEKWTVDLMEELLPRHLQIIYEINRRHLDEVREKFGDDGERLRRMSIIEEEPVKQVRMANLAVVGSHSVNGVAAIHSNILKNTIFRDFSELWPRKFNNKTNGITQRRWLLLANPELSALITKQIGDDWICNLNELKKLKKLAGDKKFREAWAAVKKNNKKQLAAYIAKNNEVDVNVDSIFECQVKRLHEYKRQLLEALHAITLYNRIKQNPRGTFAPRTIIFAGKAAPGYVLAKLIIKLINSIGDVVNNDPEIGDRLKVVFLENYSVTLAQKIMPAADLSVQISTAGLEASGTGNMKFSLNGALTIGTLDGANIEIMEEVGRENIFIFGLNAQEVLDERKRGYNPYEVVHQNGELARCLDMIAGGAFSNGDTDLFTPIIETLLTRGDYYLVLRDYSSYMKCHELVAETFLDREKWTAMSILNACNMGKFSSDRTISEYAREIWDVEPVDVQRKRRTVRVMEKV